MFFEVNNSVYDSLKLVDRRDFVKNCVFEKLFSSGFIRVSDNVFFVEDSLLVLEVNFFGVEDYCCNNFSF